MNNLPPKISSVPSAPASARRSKPLAPLVIVGIAAGFVAGFIAASAVCCLVAVLFFSIRTARVGAPTMPMESSPAMEASDKAAMTEIDAAAHLSFENNILAQFNEIAARPNLSPDAHIHLIDMTFKRLSFENNQLQVLLKLIANPSFSPAAKEKILKELKRVSLENNKQALLDAMNRRENQQ